MNWEDFKEIIGSIATNIDGDNIDFDSIKSDIEDDPDSYEIVDVIGHRVVTRHGDFIVAANSTNLMRTLDMGDIPCSVRLINDVTLVSLVPMSLEAAESLKSLKPADQSKCEITGVGYKDVVIVAYSQNELDGRIIGVWSVRNWQKYVDGIIRSLKNDLMSVIGIANKHILEDDNNRENADLI